MTLFAEAMVYLVGVEGGRVDDPKDRGGRTNVGVTQRTYDAWRAAHHLSPADVWGMADEERDDIYLHDYWLAARCDLLAEASQRIALCHFDASVLHGIRRVRKDGVIVGSAVMLQEVVGVERDGWVGPGTLNAMLAFLRQGGEGMLVNTYLDLRRKRCARIVEADPSQARFLKGWLNRLELLAAAASRLSPAYTLAA